MKGKLKKKKRFVKYIIILYHIKEIAMATDLCKDLKKNTKSNLLTPLNNTSSILSKNNIVSKEMEDV